MTEKGNNTPPKILTDNGLSFFVNDIGFRDEDLPIQDIHINDLTWHFDMPVWERDETDDWNLTPWEVIRNFKGTSEHRKKIEEADTAYPIILSKYKDKLIILDGIHRLVKVYESGGKIIKAKIVPEHLLKLRQ